MEINRPMVNFVLLFLACYMALVWENTTRDSLRYLIYMLFNVIITFSVIMFNRLYILDIFEQVMDKIYGRVKEVKTPQKEDEVKRFIE
jgi:hypothetical protein